MDEENIKKVLDDVETQINADRLVKQGAFAMGAAELAGGVFMTALTNGIPVTLAQEMAADFWNATVFPGHILVAEDAEEGEG